MDFLATVKKRLEELEEQARQMQALEQPAQATDNKLFQPRSKAGPKAGSKSGPKSGPRGGARNSASPQSSARSLASPDGFVTPKCATADISPGRTGSESSRPSSKPLNRRLIDDLQGRLDEAFLLSEVLGAPRCVRGWDDD